jgi:hypothetical protein
MKFIYRLFVTDLSGLKGLRFDLLDFLNPGCGKPRLDPLDFFNPECGRSRLGRLLKP